ncbi:MAG: sulfotransferase family 2 domain-containing protein [Candidatus Promineifilaceae bacterium]
MKSETTAIFLHLPKTAGTTLLRILDRQYPSASVYSIEADAHASVRQFRELPEEARGRFRLVRGHLPYGIHTAIPRPTSYFTILRDPVERVLSYYFYILRTPGHYLYDIVMSRNLGLKELLETGLALMMNDGQVRLLSGVWGDVEFGGCTPEIVAAAQHHLAEAFTVVGLTEQFDISLLLLKKQYGWRHIYYLKENVTSHRPQQADLPPGTIDMVRQCNQGDLALYAWAQTHLAEQIRLQGPLFPAQLAAFHLGNRPYREIRHRSVRTFIRRHILRQAI